MIARRASLALAGLLATALAACHGSPPPATASATASPAPSPATSADTAPAPASPPQDWWRAAEPTCPGGAPVEIRSLTYGRLLFCGDKDDRDTRLVADDLGRIARCVHDAIGALQTEPEAGDLAGFLDRAILAGVAPNLCGAVRRDADKRVLTSDRRPVLFDRTMRGEDLYDDGSAVLGVRYRFACQTCDVAAEIAVEVAVGGAP